jgi:hypothetical protein
VAVALLALGVLAACGDDDGGDDDGGSAATTTTAAEAESEAESDEAAVESTLVELTGAIRTGDAEEFLALVTEDGVESFGWGNREQVLSGEGGFGQEEIGEAEFSEITVEGDTASAVGDIAIRLGVYRLGFELVREGDRWLASGMEFVGTPPLGPDTPVVEVVAGDYAFTFDRDAATTGDFAIHFVNEGADAHEITMFRAPPDATVEDAQAALAGVDGSELSNIPAPFELVDHIAYAEPGQEADFLFAEPLEPGHYVIVCYIPQGAHTEADFETATGPPHIQLGMVADFTVRT